MDSGRVDINNVLGQMRLLREQVQNPALARPQQDLSASRELQLKGIQQGPDAVGKTDFHQVFSSAINKVNELQKTSGQLAEAYQLGDNKVSLSDVMVASQKSGVAFQAMTQIRNRLVEAYQEVMNMPV